MSWIQTLYNTYEKNKFEIGQIDSNGALLLPIFHLTINSNIEIVLNSQGEFITAQVVSSDERVTIAPCTEESSIRSGRTPLPHALADKLQYIARDYPSYGLKWHGYAHYLKILEDWASYEKAIPEVQAVLDYVKKNDVIKDLLNHKLFEIEDGKLTWGIEAREKIKVDPEDSIVRWVVEIPGVYESRTWKSSLIFENWIEFYLSTKKNTGFCYVLGKNVPLESKHPKSIYNMCANAKIISSNDSQGYTFRGRISEPQEGYGLSYEVSQKSHNALKWLITKQGYNRGKKTIICWATSGGDIPDFTEDAFGLADLEETTEKLGIVLDTAQELSNRLSRKIMGYAAQLGANEKVNILELESVTDGRLSITYFREMGSIEYLENLERWHQQCQWIHKMKWLSGDGKQKRSRYFVGAPSPLSIAEAAYGMKRNIDEKLKMKTVDRILTCILERNKIPLDLVTMSLQNTSNRVGFEEDWEFEKALSVTCALIKKYHHDYKKEEIKMALDRERATREYLYGRLLATAQNIEQWALSKSGEKRMTNADRLMNRFSQHPYSTWKVLELNLKPYLERLGGGGASSREKLLDEIMDLFEPESFIDDRPLAGEFLLGYHSQREEFRKGRETVIEDVAIENENGGIE